LASESVES
jgi:hypothetical protein